jgi:hypothetical protein
MISAPLAYVYQTLEERINKTSRNQTVKQTRNLIIDAMNYKK